MIYIFIAILILIIYAAIMRSKYETSTFEVNKINILHPNVSDREPVLLYFSDFHGTVYDNDNSRLISTIKEINPDAIIIGGDMIVGDMKKYSYDNKENSAAIELLSQLTSNYDVYYGYGNHETRIRNSSRHRVDFNSYLFRIKNDNLHILTNKHQYVTIKGTRFCIYGFEADNSYYSKKKIKYFTTEYIEKCLGESPDHKRSIPIVISHNPDAFESIAKWGAEYVLSGHNHGGFIRLPYFGGLIASNYRLFPKYSAGIYKSKEHKSTMILSKGLGNHSINFRLFNKPELIVITFKKPQ